MNNMAATRNNMRVSRTNHDIVVLGLGNTLLADDGVGVHVVRQLAADPAGPSWIRPLDGGTLGFRLLGHLRQADAVLIVDAAELGATPGTIRIFDRDELAQHVGRSGRISAHEAGLTDLLSLARLEGFAPKKLALLGIQPQTIEWGEALSPALADAASLASQLVVSIGLSWLAAS